MSDAYAFNKKILLKITNGNGIFKIEPLCSIKKYSIDQLGPMLVIRPSTAAISKYSLVKYIPNIVDFP